MTCHDIILSVSDINLEWYILRNNICYFQIVYFQPSQMQDLIVHLYHCSVNVT